jgi:predicted permease
MMQTIWQDMRYGLRLLYKTPGFTVIAVLTLALGIGANTAIFSVVNAVLLRALPYPQAERLIRVFEDSKTFPKFPLSPGDFLDHREQNTVFEEFALYTRGDLELTAGDRSQRLSAMRVSAGFFRVLGVQPLLGREFQREEELPDTNQVAILSYNLWQRTFNSDPDIVGKTVVLSGKPFTIVGVLPKGVQHVGGTYNSLPYGDSVAIWYPTTLNPKKATRNAHYLNAIGRMKPGVTAEQAAADLNTIAERLAEQYPNSNKDWQIRVTPLTEEVVGGARQTLWILLCAVAFVLLIACVNVANLMLARASAREREIAVRTALGAGRFRIIRQLLTESLVIAALGGVCGWLLAIWGIDVISALAASRIPRLHEIGVDTRVVIFTSVATLVTALIFGLAPAWQISRVNPNEALREGGRSATGSARQKRLRGTLVVVEVALSLILLVGAGLLLRSFIKALQTDGGFKSSGVLTMSVDLPEARYAKDKDIAGFYERLLERLSGLPGVQSAGASSDLPWTGYDENISFTVEGLQSPPDQTPNARYHMITPNYFSAVGVPLLAGRFFSQSDAEKSPRVILINQSMARRYWPDAETLDDVVGKRLTYASKPKEEDWWTVAGVVGDVKDTPVEAEAAPALFWTYKQQAQSHMFLALKTDGNAAAFIAAVRNEVQALDNDLPVAEVKTLDEVASAAHATRRFTLLLVCLFALLALILSSIGLYGLIAYTVSQRTHEIGVRVALGASTSNVLRLVVNDGMRLAVTGIALGLGGAFGLTRLIGSLLYGVSPTDPLTFTGVALTLTGAALLACLVPARRATRVDPLVALRYE